MIVIYHFSTLEGLVLVSSDMQPDMATSDGDIENVAKPEKRKSSRKGFTTPSSNDDGHMGQVLRSVYQRAVDEDIPSEMLDLLNKLD